jgi:esterase/lipase superfamily enzyme
MARTMLRRMINGKLKVQWFCLFSACALFCSAGTTRAAELGEQSPAVRLPVFFATDRQLIARRGVRESATLGSLKCGMSAITLPPETAWMEPQKNSLRDDLRAMGWTIDQTSTTFVPVIEDRGYVAEGAREKVVEPPTTYTEEFWKKLSSAVENSRAKKLYVYIPGFASSGINSLYAGGVLSAHVEAPVVVFSWPSDGIAGAGPDEIVKGKGMLFRYNKEEALIQSPQVLSNLTDFLEQARAKLKSAEFVLVAHSLGNRLMARYFESHPQVKFAGVYFIAPDITTDLFYRALPGIRTQSAYTAVFSHRDDRVLYGSSVKSILWGNLHSKLGLSKYNVPGVEFIDYEVVAEPRTLLTKSRHQLKHYLPFEQFGSIVRTGQPYNPTGSNNPLILKDSKIIQIGSSNNSHQDNLMQGLLRRSHS